MKSSLEYELIDFGQGRKLERFGQIVVNRPEILAQESIILKVDEWENKAQGVFMEAKKGVGGWFNQANMPEVWKCPYNSGKSNFILELKPGKYKHVGVFPEQEKHWKYIEKIIKPGAKVLNLFGYTGASSLVAAKMGGDVYHVDSSKSVVNWAAKNAKLSAISSIHWVCDDALRFAERELKRKQKYDLIVMDPPVFGHGKKGLKWKLEDLLPKLIKITAQLLNKSGKLILNTYSPRVSLQEMELEMQKNGLRCINKGWLSVNTHDGRKLNLSKYTTALRRT